MIKFDGRGKECRPVRLLDSNGSVKKQESLQQE